MIAALARLIVSPCSKRPGVVVRIDADESERDVDDRVAEHERRAAAQLGVHVGRRDAVGVEPGERPQGGRERARRAVRIAGGVEVGPLPPQQAERHGADDRVDDVALLEQVPDARDREQPERRLPGAVAAPREAAAEQHEPERGGHEQAVGDVRRSRAEQLGDDLQPPGPGRRDDRYESGEPRGGGHEREQERRARCAQACNRRCAIPHTVTRLSAADCGLMVCRAVGRRARSTLLRDGRDRAAHARAADGRPAWRRAAARGPLEPPPAPVLGRHAARRGRPQPVSMPSCASGRSRTRVVPGRLALLCDSDLEAIAALTPEQQRALLERNLAERSYTGFLETAADGLADVAYLEVARPRTEVPPDLAAAPPARRVPPPVDVPEAALPHPPFALVEDAAALAELCERLARRRRAGGRHRDRLRAARRARRLVAGRRCGAPVAGCRAHRRRDRVRRRRLLPGRAAPAPAAARRRARDHRPQRALRAGLADVPVRPPGLAHGHGHELRVPRLRAPLVDPGSGLRAPRRHPRDCHAPPAGRAEGRLRRPTGGAPSRCRPPTRLRRPTTPSPCSSCATARPGPRRAFGCTAQVLAPRVAHRLRRGVPAAAAAAPDAWNGGLRADRRRGRRRPSPTRRP